MMRWHYLNLRNVSHGLILLLLTSLINGFKEVQIDTCPNSCGTPRGLDFCTHIEFPTCRELTSWKAQDIQAKKFYDHSISFLKNHTYFNATGTSPSSLSTTSFECAALLPDLKKIHCAIQFPVCEIGTVTDRLCRSSCEQAIASCSPLVAASFCSTEALSGGIVQFDQTEDDNTHSADGGMCFTLAYAGAPYGLWIAGFTISLVFSVLNSIGINLQKYSLERNANATKKRTSCRQPIWLMGFSLVCLGSVLDFVAFGMAPQTLLAPLAALSLVWNLFIAPIFHKETITRRNIVATGIIFLGVTITVIFAGHSTPNYELDDLLVLYCEPVMYLYVVCVITFLLVLFVTKSRIERTGAGEHGLAHIICYGGIAGTFGGQSVLLAKSTVELAKSAIWGTGANDAFEHYETYLIVGGMIVCLIFQITTLNGGLKRFDALVMIPVYQSFWIFTSVLGGIMYFEEYASMSHLQTLMFPIGGGITMSGIVYLLTGRHESKKGLISYMELHSVGAAWNVSDSEDDEEYAQQRFDLKLEEEEGIELATTKSTKTKRSQSSTSEASDSSSSSNDDTGIDNL